MIRRLLLLLSLGLNAGLTLTLWQLWTAPKPAFPTTLPARTLRLPAPPPVDEQTPHAPVTAMTPATLSWSELASTDFSVYRDQLRAAGCPENTLRDILESEINQWFQQRRQPIVDALRHRFWDLAAQRGQRGFDEVEAQLDAVVHQGVPHLTALMMRRYGLEPDDSPKVSQSALDAYQEYAGAWLRGLIPEE